VIHFALSGEIQRPSLRQLALAAETSEPTLRHYFTDRKGLVIAMMVELGERAQPIWRATGRTLTRLLTRLSAACFRHALARME
jgi:AcrR family transcriptional regulator